jgi:hypothetical protein
MAEWRNWQTHQTQNLAKFTLREGSTPSSATTFVFFHIPESAGFVGHYRAIRRKNEAWTYADSRGYVKGNAWRPNRSSAPVGSVPIAGAAGMSKSGANRLQGSENCRSLGSAALPAHTNPALGPVFSSSITFHFRRGWWIGIRPHASSDSSQTGCG